MLRSWDFLLLEDWTGTTDRINKWMLHMLSADANAHAALHQGYVRDALKQQDDSNVSTEARGHAWERFVLKYCFLDEAALGINALEAIRGAGALEDASRLRRAMFRRANTDMTVGVLSSNRTNADLADLNCQKTQSETNTRRPSRRKSAASVGRGSIRTWR